MSALRTRFGVLVGLSLLLSVSLLALTACGGDDDNSSKATTSSSKATATKASSGDTGDTPAAQATSGNNDNTSGDSGGNNGNSSSSNDLGQLADKLVPPHSKQIAKYSTDDGLLVTYESTDSVDSLKDFYDNKVKTLGVKVQGTFDSGDAHTWYFGDDDSSGPGGTVIVGDDGSGKTAVTITVGRN